MAIFHAHSVALLGFTLVLLLVLVRLQRTQIL